MKGVRRSHNETKSLLTRAALGGGVSFGLADDMGRAGLWLETCGQDGGGAILAAVNNYDDAGAAAVLDGDTAVFADAGAAGGLAALEYLVAKAARQVRVQGGDAGGCAPLLLVGFAGLAAIDYGLSTRLVFSGGEIVVSATRVLLPPCGVNELSGEVTITPTINQKPTSLPIEKIFIDEIILKKLESLAMNFYVPPVLGQTIDAGAGLLDND